MTTQNFRMVDIKGLSPAVEPTRSNELFVLDGRNYVFNSLGPRSIYGNRLLLPHALGAPIQTQGFRIRLKGESRCFTFTSDSILEWSEAAGGWLVIYTLTGVVLSPRRWTWAYLNGYLYFCHAQIGILSYNVDTGICAPHTGPGVPSQALAISENNGFLVAITPTHYYWSQPSDGQDFTPQLGGAGFQKISDRVPGYPIMVTSYTQGCLTWTTSGVMRSEFVADSSVYRHRALQTEYRPVNSFCTCRVDDDTVVILDERGLFKTRGDAPQPYTPLFNEFLSEYIQANDLKIGENLRVEWDELSRLMYISTSLSYSDQLYENCFVLYPNLDKWGQFNEDHYGILPILIEGTARADDYFGYVDSAGCVRYFLDTGSREISTATITAAKRAANLVYPRVQKPVEYPDDLAGPVVSSSGVCNTIPTETLTQPASYYAFDGSAPIAAEREGLNARIVIGLLRPTGDSASDELSEVTNLVLRSTTNDKTFAYSDFNTTPPVTQADLNVQGVQSSLRFNSEEYVNHQMRLIGTVDGETAFDLADPKLVGFAKGVRYYACSVVGVWHILEMSAINIGESFQPSTIEFTATSAGRLN